MQKNRIPFIVQWWVTPKLPIEHVFIPQDKRPKEPTQIARVYLRKWLVHPLKRRLAKYYVWLLQKLCRLTVIGITGSCGKTTTKEMLASILSRKGKTMATFANIDPVYNIPTTILRCSPLTKYLILEMGVEYPGEMDFYLWLVKPKIGIITNIYPTHTQFFKDVEGVAREKGKLTFSLAENSFVILNKDNDYCRKIGKLARAKTFWFGNKADVMAINIVYTKDMNTKFTLKTNTGKKDIQLPILGRPFVSNALAAASAAIALGVLPDKIKFGLETFLSQAHRVEIKQLSSGAVLIDDSYNNNPQAAKEILSVFNKIAAKKKKIVVFGDMLELGDLEEQYHREIGKYLSSLKLDYLIGVGQLSRFVVEEAGKLMGDNVDWVEKEDGVYPKLKSHLKADAVILIKGSRSIGLDSTVSKLS